MPFSSTNEKLTLFGCCLSFIGGVCTFCSYLVGKKWRVAQEDAKRVYFVMTVFEWLDSINLMVQNTEEGIWCNFQADVIQATNVNAKLYETCLSIETMYLVYHLVEKITPKAKLKRRFYRHSVYFVFAVLHSFITILLINVYHQWGLAGPWCWITDPLARLSYCYFMLWIGQAVIIVCNYFSVMKMKNLFKTCGKDVMDKQTFYFFIRMGICPVSETRFRNHFTFVTIFNIITFLFCIYSFHIF